MRNFLRHFMIVGLVSYLSACSTATPPTDEQVKKIKTAKINAQLGIVYLERHDVQRAKQKLLLALDQAPEIPETWYSMAYFQETTGNKEQANQAYLKAIALAPGRGDVQNNYGTFLCRNGQYRVAINHFKAAISDQKYLDPADAYENAGLCALKIPDQKTAKQYFKLALLHDVNRIVSKNKLDELMKA